MAKPTPIQPRVYIQMQKHIRKAYKGVWWFRGFSAVALAWGVFIFVKKIQAAKPLVEAFTVAEIWAVNLFLVLAFLYFSIRYLKHDEIEEKLVDAGVDFLRMHKCNEAQRQTILQRAQIGSAAGQTRTILPLLLIPMMLAVLNQFPMDTGSILFSILLIGYVVTSFFRELGRANIDVVIVQSLAEYDYDLKYPQPTSQAVAKSSLPTASTSSLKPQTLAKATVPAKHASQGSSKQKRNRSNHR